MKNILSLLLLLSTTIVFSQENIPYQKPSSEILELVEFDRPPAVIYDDDKNLLGIAKLATPVLKKETDSYTFKLKLDF